MNKTSGICVLVGLILLQVGCYQRMALIEVPEGYVGWVTVRYEDPECATDKKNGMWNVIPIEYNGMGCSKEWNGAKGLAWVRTYYVDRDGEVLRKLEDTGWGEGGAIWGAAADLEEREYFFFVGSEQAFKNWTSARKTR